LNAEKKSILSGAQSEWNNPQLGPRTKPNSSQKSSTPPTTSSCSAAASTALKLKEISYIHAEGSCAIEGVDSAQGRNWKIVLRSS
jgi:hypothetical protein